MAYVSPALRRTRSSQGEIVRVDRRPESAKGRSDPWRRVGRGRLDEGPWSLAALERPGVLVLPVVVASIGPAGGAAAAGGG